MHDLPALLKVRTIHAVLITLLLVAVLLQFASSLWQQPRLMVDVFSACLPERLVLHRRLCNHRRGAGTACAGARTHDADWRTSGLVLLWQLWHLVARSNFSSFGWASCRRRRRLWPRTPLSTSLSLLVLRGIDRATFDEAGANSRRSAGDGCSNCGSALCRRVSTRRYCSIRLTKQVVFTGRDQPPPSRFSTR
jgi:hypothetical protein